MNLKENKAVCVVMTAVLTVISCGCNGQNSENPGELPRLIQKNITQVGYISYPEIKECSGIIPCKTGTNLFWTHTDGHHPILFAINRSGKCVARFVVSGAPVIDFEDIARDDKGHIYIGDIGNNDVRRSVLAVYVVNEPAPEKGSGAIPSLYSYRLTFPDKPFDCESLFIYKDYGYVISKVFNDAPAEIYRFPLSETNKTIKLQLVAKLPITSPVTSADITSDASLLALTAKNGVYCFEINGDINSAANIKPHHVKFRSEHIEGCCFVPDGLLVTSEDRTVYLFTHKFFIQKSSISH
jgi:hypothetical protein